MNETRMKNKGYIRLTRMAHSVPKGELPAVYLNRNEISYISKTVEGNVKIVIANKYSIEVEENMREVVNKMPSNKTVEYVNGE